MEKKEGNTIDQSENVSLEKQEEEEYERNKKKGFKVIDKRIDYDEAKSSEDFKIGDENEDISLEQLEVEDIDRLIVERDRLDKKQEEFFDDVRVKIGDVFNKPDKKVKSILSRVLEKIDKSTNLIREIDDTIGKDNLLKGIGEGEYPVSVEFGKDMELGNVADTERQTFGTYSAKENKIEIADSVPTSMPGLLAMLAIRGMPEMVKTLDHELIHHTFNLVERKERFKDKINNLVENFSYFLKRVAFAGVFSVCLVAVESEGEKIFKKGMSTRDVLSDIRSGQISVDKGFALEIILRTNSRSIDSSAEEMREEMRKLLSEIVAQKAGRVYRKESDTTLSLLDTLKDHYGYSDPEDIDKIIVASQSVDQLRVLGLSDTEIAQNFARDEYDKKTISFPEIEKKIGSLAKDKNIDVEDLDTLVDISRIKNEIDNSKASIIAQDGLRELVK